MEQKGMELFFSPKLNCSKCHGGANFSSPSVTDSAGELQNYFNTGLYEQYPNRDQGLYEKTLLEKDRGKFRVPTLRNLAFTAPYFHDGSVQTLDEVIAAYESGGKNHPNKDPLIKGFQLSSSEKKALISFLFSLSDSSICNNQSFSNPFNKDETKY